MSPTDVAARHSADQTGSPPTAGGTSAGTITEEKPDKAEPVDRVKKDSADTEKKTTDEWNKRPVGLIDLMR